MNNSTVASTSAVLARDSRYQDSELVVSYEDVSKRSGQKPVSNPTLQYAQDVKRGRAVGCEY